MGTIFNVLTDKATQAIVAAIQAYNNPPTVYRAETFSILAVNGWELLVKAKWLKEHGDDIAKLYAMETVKTEDGSRKRQIKLSRSGNPVTEGLTSLVGKLNGRGMLSVNGQLNLDALVEIRDSAIHFYDESGRLEIRVHEIATASVLNFASVMKEWFALDVSEKCRFPVLPLSFVDVAQSDAIVTNHEVENLLDFLDSLEVRSDKTDSEHSVAVNIEVNLTRKPKSSAVPEVRVTNKPDAIEVRLTEEQILERYPLRYRDLTDMCKEMYSDFKENKRYHDIRNPLKEDARFAHTRWTDPEKPQSGSKTFFSHAIFREFDNHYTKRESCPST